MIDPSEQERIALLMGGQDAGDYLDSLKVTDLAKLNDAQWLQFLRCVVGGYQAALQASKQSNHSFSHDNSAPF